MIAFPEGYFRIETAEHKTLLEAPFNPPANGYDDAFSEELNSVWKQLFDHFSKLGVYASPERYDFGQPSDWWMNDDGYWASRGMGVDILNPQLQTWTVVEGVRAFIRTLPEPWMIFLYHNNSHDDKGHYVGAEGEYFIWVTLENVRVFSPRDKDIRDLVKSFPGGGGFFKWLRPRR